MLGWVLRLILLLILIRLAWRFIAHVIDGIAGAARSPEVDRGAQGPVPLVKDPVCGTYVVRDKAITASASGHTVCFCSEHCRQQWLAGHRAERA